MVTQMMIFRTGENPVYGEENIKLTLTDEAAGAFFIVEQGGEGVRLELDEIAAIYNHANKMMQDYCAKTDKV